MYDPPLEIPGSSEAQEAEDIEMRAADRAYRAGLGASEWEAFLTGDEWRRLKILAIAGCGTWGRDRDLSIGNG